MLTYVKNLCYSIYKERENKQMTREEKINLGLKEHWHDFETSYPKTESVGLFLQGSQNYKLDYEGSDIDTKMIILPSFDDFVNVNKPISYTYVRENNEHIDLKDIRVILDTIKKQNINFVEILFTEYKIINNKYEKYINELFKYRERIARYNVYGALNCMVGMAMQKYKAMEHPYPTVAPKIEKYKYDPKQLHHIIRMREFIQRYIQGEPYSECLVSNQLDYLIEVKKGLHTLEEARKIAETLVSEIQSIKDEYMKHYSNTILIDVDELMKEVKLCILKQYFKEQLFKGE